MAEDVTMFTDDTVELAGPVVDGPALHAWAEDVRAGRVPPDAEPAVLAEIHGLTGQTFPSRRLQSAYLRWTCRRALAALPPSVTVHEHRTTALAATGPRGASTCPRARSPCCTWVRGAGSRTTPRSATPGQVNARRCQAT